MQITVNVPTQIIKRVMVASFAIFSEGFLVFTQIFALDAALMSMALPFLTVIIFGAGSVLHPNTTVWPIIVLSFVPMIITLGIISKIDKTPKV